MSKFSRETRLKIAETHRKNRDRRVSHHRYPPGAKQEKIKRTCLGPDDCKKTFYTYSKFHRLCDTCKKNVTDRDTFNVCLRTKG